MKTLPIILVCLLPFNNFLFSQQYDLAVSFMSEARDGIWDIKSDGSTGDYYITGFFEGDLEVNGVLLEHVDGQEFYLAKFDSEDQLIWVEVFSGEGFDRGNELSIDADGNVYLAALFSGTMNLQGTEITSNGNQDILIAKYSSAGDLLWHFITGGPSSDICYAVYVGSNSLLAVGQYSSEMDFGGITLTANGSSDMWVASLDFSNGAVNWVRSFGGIAADRLYHIVEDDEGNLAACGYFSDVVQIGSETIVSQNGQDPLMIKLDADGNPLWTAAFASPGANDNVWDLDSDDEGYYLSGTFTDSLVYDGYALVTTHPGISNAFIRKINKDGSGSWGTNTDTDENSYGGWLGFLGQALIQSSYIGNGKSFVGTITGISGTAATVQCLQHWNGQTEWQFIFDGPESNYAVVGPKTVSPYGFIIGLAFQDSVQILGETVTGVGDEDVIVFQFSGALHLATNEAELAKFEELAKAHWSATEEVLYVAVLDPVVERVNIYTLDGTLLESQEAQENMQFHLPGLPASMLAVQLQSEGQVLGKLVPAIH
ncbi:MAG: hypothetical protein KDC34_07515 [Saprospiraceae bacterium]|nr:hypothetical protein [Saprospiraceae bacterium]